MMGFYPFGWIEWTPWEPLAFEITQLPTVRPAELLDHDRMPLGATWTLPPDPWFGRMKRWLRGIR